MSVLIRLESTLDLHDLNLGVRLSVTDLLLLVLLGLVLQNIDLLVLTVLENLGSNLGTFNSGSTYLEAVVVGQCLYAVENDLVSFICFELFNKDNVLLDYFVLLSAGFDNCKHEKHLSF